MLVPDGGGGAVRAAQSIEYVLEELKAIGTKKLPDAKQEAQAKVKEFAGQRLPAEAFGGSPGGRRLAAVHDQAHAVFTETLNGILQDLEEFRQRLLDSVKHVEATDDAVVQGMKQLEQSGPPDNAGKAQGDAVRDHAPGVVVPPGQGGSGAESTNPGRGAQPSVPAGGDAPPRRARGNAQ